MNWECREPGRAVTRSAFDTATCLNLNAVSALGASDAGTSAAGDAAITGGGSSKHLVTLNFEMIMFMLTGVSASRPRIVGLDTGASKPIPSHPKDQNLPKGRTQPLAAPLLPRRSSHDGRRP